MTRPPDDSQPSRRLPDYVVVIAVSDAIKDRFPFPASLDDALRAGKDRHHDPEPDLEAEP